MTTLTEQHIAVLRALVASARASDSDVGMDVNVLAALLDDWSTNARAARLLAAMEQIDALVQHVFYEVHLHRNGVFLYNGSGWGGTFGTGEPLADGLIALAEKVKE